MVDLAGSAAFWSGISLFVSFVVFAVVGWELKNTFVEKVLVAWVCFSGGALLASLFALAVLHVNG